LGGCPPSSVTHHWNNAVTLRAYFDNGDSCCENQCQGVFGELRIKGVKAMGGRVSLHIGVNKVDPAHYGSEAPLRGCENDAKDMQSIASAAGYSTDILLTKNATSRNLLERLSSAAKSLVAGDTFLLTLACHGSQVKDVLGEEDDGEDETWCLFDRMLIDDEAYNAFSQFRDGVRIVVFSDSCHSGSSTRVMLAAKKESATFLSELNIADDTIFRCIDPYIDHSIFDKSQPLYEAIKFALPRARSRSMISRSQSGPDVLLISGCQDNQLSGDGAVNGYFTENVKAVWNSGSFQGNYREFRQKVSDRMNTPSQVPNLFTYGPNVETLVKERPLVMSATSTRDINDTSGMTENTTRCHMEFPTDRIIGKSEDEVRQYIMDNIAPLMIDTCLDAISSAIQPRSTRSGARGSWEVGCEKSSSGEGKCSVKVGGSF
jgi:metacaspase-1